MSFRVPDACTLPTAAQPLRQAEFETLCRTAMRKQERLTARHLRLTLGSDNRAGGDIGAAGSDDLAETVRDLAARENECCSFFDFTVTPAADVVVLDIEVPAAYVDVLDELSTLAGTASSTVVR